MIRLVFAKNEAEEYVDPVTFKPFTDNSHIVAVRHGETANVFGYDTVERLNIKTKNWKDLVSEETFSREDIIVLQDPQNLESRNLASFKYLKDGEDTGIAKSEASINLSAMGSAEKIVRAKEAVAQARAKRVAENSTVSSKSKEGVASQKNAGAAQSGQNKAKITPYNASHHTTGLAAASFTSTGVTPHTSGALALLSEEEYLLKRGRVKQSGFARMETNHGSLNIELLPEYAPKAVWNFVRLAQKGYYNGVTCHRNIRNFMLQGGDPTGTGKGGSSIWGKNFEDEFEGPLKHNGRGMVSMANKGKNTNSSQFFITYREVKHLDRKHTIFGRVVESQDVLTELENVPTDANSRPTEAIVIKEVAVYVDPFEEFVKSKKEGEEGDKLRAERKTQDDEQTTWTGKRIRSNGDGVQEDGGVGKYLRSNAAPAEDEIVEFVDDLPEVERPKKKARGAGFGNFEGW